jgi:hypothetical protein
MASSVVVSSSSRTRSALESFFTPASIAVIGATEREGSVGQSAEQEQCSQNDVSDSVAKYYHLILQTDTSRTLSGHRQDIRVAVVAQRGREWSQAAKPGFVA